MPPKKGKKSGGKGKKGKKGEPEISFQEAVLAYRIGLCEKQIEDWKFEEKNLEEQHERLEERNTRLLEEQQQYVKLLKKNAREFEKKNAMAEKVGKTQVMEALEDKWVASKAEERRLEEMQAEILNLEKTIARNKREKAKWQAFKARGASELESQIKLLEKVLKDMSESFEEMKEHLARSFETSKEKLILMTERTLDQQKHAASEKAMSTLGKNDRQEVLDNDWMQGELESYQMQCDQLQAEVSAIEKENLELMEELFDHNVEDLKVTRNLFLTQFADQDNLADGGILEVDLTHLSIMDKSKQLPKYDPLPAITQSGETEATEEIDDYLDNYYEMENMEDLLQLGPLELKLLTLTGESKTIHKLGATSSSDSNTSQSIDGPSEWPVTQPMLKLVAQETS